MPVFQVSPQNLNVPLLVPGNALYLLGSYASTVSPTSGSVTSVAVATNAVTLGVKILSGNAPANGSLITVAATTTDSGGANVSNVAISSSSINAVTGIGTITYPATASNQSTTADSGYWIVSTPEVGEVIANGASLACAVQANTGPENGRTIRFDVTFSSPPPDACVVVAQSCGIYDYTGNSWSTIGTVASIAGGVISGGSMQQQLDRSGFIRFLVSGVTSNTSPPLSPVAPGQIIAKVTV